MRGVVLGAPMYVHFLSRIFMACVVALALTSCGGGGGGGDTLIGTPPDSGDGDGTSTTGTIALEISGLVDENGSPDNVLAGNEFGTLTATVTENGQPASVVVVFETSIGTLVPTSAQTSNGVATVQITGDGTAGAATVTARATLSNGDEITAQVIVQTSSSAPAISFTDDVGDPIQSVELLAAASQRLVFRLEDWDGTPLEGVGVNFALTFDGDVSMEIDINAGQTDADGEVEVTLTGTQLSGTGELTVSSTFAGFDFEEVIPITGLGVDEQLNNITLDVIDTGADEVLAGNEKTMVVARVLEDGVAKNGIVVEFSTGGTGGTLTPASAISANNGTDDGVAMVQLIGDATAGTATITASATLSNSIQVSDSQTIQTSAEGPTLTLVARNAAGISIDTFGANQELTLEATIVDHDGTALDSDDAGVNVTFDGGDLGTLVNTSDVSEFAACPVNGVKENTDCAYVSFTSNSTGEVGQFTATATINGIALSDDLQVTNTGINSGSPDQDSFSISRVFSGNIIATTDTLAIEGDLFNGQEATIRVDLADFFNNPVPDGTLVNFLTELGDIDASCETASGQCEVIFTSSEPRTPIDTEVSFRNLNDDNCPSTFVKETVTINSSGDGLTEYRVSDVLSVALNAAPTIIFDKDVDYRVTANGIECLAAPCDSNDIVDITYQRLWLDELDDGSTAHVIANPGEATEPFLEVTGTPCLAGTRDELEVITGSINPSGTTSVVGSGTSFLSELAVGDRLKVSGEVRTITSIASDTSLQVDTAFSDNLNDVSPERIAAPGYRGGMGQPYGGRSTILAYALGEESFVDVNGNEEYDFGETFFDLTEVFLDKNEDDVLGDVTGESASVTNVGPYSDAGTGGDPEGAERDKSAPFCYGPQTIVGDPDGSGSSTEQEVYCYQDGGEEEIFIDLDGDTIMAFGNGIYNGSRCLTPLQDADDDGDADDVVCTTDLVNISKETQILMAGTPAFIEFRTTSGGANGGGEIISEVESTGGQAISNTVPSADTWTIEETTAVTSVTVQKGADVDTSALGAGDMDAELVSIAEVFTTTNATWDLSLEVTRTDGGANTGDVEVFASGSPLTFDGGTCGDTSETCTVTGFTVDATGDLIIASVDDSDPLIAEINNVTITGTTSGTSRQFRIRNGATVTSNDNTDTALTEFDVGDTIDADTVFAGVSERFGNDGATVPSLSTTDTFLIVYFTDLYNGELPRDSVVKIESDNSAGCTITSVGGVAVNSNDPGPTSGSNHFGEITIGADASTFTTLGLTTGFGPGAVTVSVTVEPSNSVTSRSILCEL